MPVLLSVRDTEALVASLRSAGCVFAEDEARLLSDAATSPEELGALTERRVSGHPLEYLLGWVEFFGLRLSIDAGVFVPRRRTEFLVREAIAHANSGATVLDLCCGCGAVGIAISSAIDGAELYAADIDPAAVANAKRNFDVFGGRVFEGDLFDALPDSLHGKVNILTANVPYVPTDAIPLLPPEARDYEPRFTLDGGPDGLDVLRRVAGEARQWLAPGGHVFFETGADQSVAAAEIVGSFGLAARIVTSSHFHSTLIVGTRRA